MLHISGPDTALNAMTDSPDQHLYNLRIDSISLSDSTLHYQIPPYDIEYSDEILRRARELPQVKAANGWNLHRSPTFADRSALPPRYSL